ncbi:PIR Superfamily Protein, partial [Plasmodium malariae]
LIRQLNLDEIQLTPYELLFEGEFSEWIKYKVLYVYFKNYKYIISNSYNEVNADICKNYLQYIHDLYKTEESDCYWYGSSICKNYFLKCCDKFNPSKLYLHSILNIMKINRNQVSASSSEEQNEMSYTDKHTRVEFKRTYDNMGCICYPYKKEGDVTSRICIYMKKLVEVGISRKTKYTELYGVSSGHILSEEELKELFEKQGKKSIRGR